MLSSVYKGLHILLHNGVQEHLGDQRVAAGLEGEGHGEVYQTSIWVIALGRVKFPHSFQVIKYFYISTDGGYEKRLQKVDVTGVGEVEEWLEPNHEVGGQSTVFLQGDSGFSTVRNKVVIILDVRHHREHLVLTVSNYSLLTEDNHILTLRTKSSQMFPIFEDTLGKTRMLSLYAF